MPNGKVDRAARSGAFDAGDVRGGAEVGQRLRRYFGMPGTMPLDFSNAVVPVIIAGDATAIGNAVTVGRRLAAGLELAVTPSRVHFYANPGVARDDGSNGVVIEHITIGAAAAANTAATAPEIRIGAPVVPASAINGQYAWTERPVIAVGAAAGGYDQSVTIVAAGDSTATTAGGQIILKPYLAAGETKTFPVFAYLPMVTTAGVVTNAAQLWVNNFSAGTLSVWVTGYSRQ
jgi:hypothetical protein